MQFLKFFIVALAIFVAQGQDPPLPEPGACPIGELDWPHHDCTKFYLCDDDGTGHVVDCQENMYWNPEEHYCDFKDNVPECIDGTRPPIGTTVPASTTVSTTAVPTTAPPTTAVPTTAVPTTAPPTTTGQPDTTTTSPPSTNSTTTTTEETPEPEPTGSTTTHAPGVCPDTGISKISHPEYCDAYYLCINGDRQEPYSVCPSGLYFDPKIEDCNFATDVDCEGDATAPPASTTMPPTSTASTQSPIFECPQEGIHTIPYNGNCTLYIRCIQGESTVYRCPDGTIFDTLKLVCEWEETAVCTVGLFFEQISIIQQQQQKDVKISNSIVIVDVVISDEESSIFNKILSKFRIF
jgi:hypothetical protein